MSELEVEKTTLLTENERLNVQLTAHLNDPESIHISLRYQEEYKKESERLREANYRLEAIADDSKLRTQVLEKQLGDLQQKLALSQSVHDEALRNKDELDSLREAAAKVPQLENSIQLYKRKLEGVDVLKQHMKELEEQNGTLIKVCKILVICLRFYGLPLPTENSVERVKNRYMASASRRFFTNQLTQPLQKDGALVYIFGFFFRQTLRWRMK